MQTDEIVIRRATIEDIAALGRLWRACDFDAPALERRLTEFHVALDSGSRLLGALGFQVEGTEGLLHSEAYQDVDALDKTRDLLLARVDKMSDALGLIRIWTSLDIENAGAKDFQLADTEAMKAFPQGFGDWKQSWKVAQLREAAAAPANLEKQLELFKLENRRTNQQIVKGARILKVFTNLLLIVIALALIVGLFLVLKNLGHQGG